MNDIKIFDGLLDPQSHNAIWNMLMAPGWQYGSVSNPNDEVMYWAKHYAGPQNDPGTIAIDAQQQLEHTNPTLFNLWKLLKSKLAPDHILTRCYVNGYPYGTEGALHVDANEPGHFTMLYYPHPEWHPDWAGETLFFNSEGNEVIAAVYPRPNRLVMFPAQIPHVGRGVTRICPYMRMTLMFKTKLK